MSIKHCIASLSLSLCFTHSPTLPHTFAFRHLLFFWHWCEFQGTRLSVIHSVCSISLPASLYHLVCFITICFAQDSVPSPQGGAQTLMAPLKHKNIPHFLGFTTTCLYRQICEAFALDPVLFRSVTCQKAMLAACDRFMSQPEHHVSLMGEQAIP